MKTGLKNLPKKLESNLSTKPVRFSLITLFSEACDAYLNASILGRAREQKKISISYQNPRDFVENKWGKVDERPYGGGPGMVLQAMPIVRAVEKILGNNYGHRKSIYRRSTMGNSM